MRRRGLVAGVTALALLALTGCGADAGQRALAACLPGTWQLDTGSAAPGVQAAFAESGLAIDSVDVRGTQVLVISKRLHLDVNADITWTARGTTRDGRDLVLQQSATGLRSASVELAGDTVRFGSVDGMLDEDLTARLDGDRTRRHYRMPSTAVIGRPGTLACTADTLTLERLHGVTLTFQRVS